ncbi:MAG: hypothetical protein WC562_05965 [Dehalococcoidia bacterium]
MNRSVAFLDVLGFKQLVNSTSAEELGLAYTAASNNLGRLIRPLMEPGKEPTFFPSRDLEKPYCIKHTFSDSIILVSHDDTEQSALELLIYTLRVVQTLMVQKFLVRGGVSFGDMYINIKDAIFVGKALTEAWELEEKQEWAGVTINNNLESKFPSIFNGTRNFGDILNCLFPKYSVPMKSGAIEELYTINWRWNLFVKNGTKVLFPNASDWATKRKVDNSLTYAKKMRDSGLAYPKNANDAPIEVRAYYISDGPPPWTSSHGDEY